MKTSSVYRRIIPGVLVLLALAYGLEKLPGNDYQQVSQLLVASIMLVIALAVVGLFAAVILYLWRRFRDRQ